MRRGLWLAALLCWGGLADAACRQALALGLDVSGSVDAREYRLQLDGLASALEDPEVLAALLVMPETPVAIAVFEWSGPGSQRVVAPWRVLQGPADVAELASRLRATLRGEMGQSTAIGSAKVFGAALLDAQPACWRRVLDLSGDGRSNTGPRPQDRRPDGITINGLVIGASADADGIGALASYYRAYVIAGPDAFVETALGFEAFEEAMIRKLKRELQVLAVSER
ncbi:DUF1194 domain-containing protein [Mameliella sediminis]|uniref:DUF1194 domain-containing protein n=1 Tax=Mameliella sediminis TaxID=2836866 RepID=UPI001C4578CF|nr:DUF1194 domain-containing protein [Mameliella sediminis]MBV7394625.1 DUF1194 domain-containing protein [Mameliella sediminis]MBY6164015.1 DUF1194 domain-containing protein [Mameliella alba]MBY6172487.1 DUF1194 domain-containing protein [Mameliella alba]MBY6177501.1 DUF1194 domain-containing protein [Mameliella alba]